MLNKKTTNWMNCKNYKLSSIGGGGGGQNLTTTM